MVLPHGFRLSPFFAPPGWQPARPRLDREVIIQIDLSPMKHLAMLDNYYDILAPQVGTHLSNDDYTALFSLYKVIYPNYASRHYAQELVYELVLPPSPLVGRFISNGLNSSFQSRPTRASSF